MKAGKSFLWILTIGVTAVLLALGFHYYRDAKSEQAELTQAIATARHTLDVVREADVGEIEARIDELESRKRSAEATTASLEMRFRDYTHTIEIAEIIFEAAKETNVTMSSLAAMPGEPVDLNGVTYRQIRYLIGGEAPVGPQLMSFSMKVTDELRAADYVAVEMEIPDAAAVEEGDELPPTLMEMQLVVYYLD